MESCDDALTLERDAAACWCENGRQRHLKAAAAAGLLQAGAIRLRSRSGEFCRLDLSWHASSRSHLDRSAADRGSRSELLRGAAARRKFCAVEGPATSIPARRRKLRLR